MDADVTVFVAQIPVFQTIGSLPVVGSLHDLGDFLRAHAHADIENIIENGVDQIALLPLRKAGDFIQNRHRG